MNQTVKNLFGGISAFAALMLVILIVIVLGYQGCGQVKDFNRHQKIKNAENNVKITSINISKAQQQARIVRAQIATTKARAEMKYQESIGIKRAQVEIARSLTPLYIQHEAIQAQEHGGASKIYIPTGANGIPLVNDVSTSDEGK